MKTWSRCRGSVVAVPAQLCILLQFSFFLSSLKFSRIRTRNPDLNMNRPGEGLLKDAELNEEGHEIPTRDILHHKVQVVPVLQITQ